MDGKPSPRHMAPALCVKGGRPPQCGTQCSKSIAELRRKRRNFGTVQRTERAFRERTERHRPDRDAHEPQHADILRGEKPPDLAVAAFVEHDLEPRVLLGAAKVARR